jgi:short-subunit dehydrogenase
MLHDATPRDRAAGSAGRSRAPVWSNPGTVLITGATGGIGVALALNYASAGRTLILHGRDTARLAALRAQCEALGARVLTLTFDVRDADSTVRELRRVSQQQAIDLAIVNAGVTRMMRDGDEAESVDIARGVLDVNLIGAWATVAGVLPDMRRRGSGQIALISSLAAFVTLPKVPAYSASKAALRAYGEALRPWLAPQGIAVNVVLPGFVHTEMTSQISGPKPFLMSAERAARIIRHGLERDRPRIAFPRAFAWGAMWISILPKPLSIRILRMLGLDQA